MNIDKATLGQLETLAKLTINEAEEASTVKKIVSVLDMLDKIDSNEISHLTPLHHPLEIQQPLRADIPNPNIDRDALQKQSPQIEKGLFLVPKVIE